MRSFYTLAWNAYEKAMNSNNLRYIRELSDDELRLTTDVSLLTRKIETDIEKKIKFNVFYNLLHQEYLYRVYRY